jgi:single-stranded-DNA-specific exonuclease
VPGFDVHAALSECREYLLSYGGHPAAAGLKIEAAQVDSFREAFCEYAAKNLRPEQRTAELWIDAETTLGCLNLTTVQQIERLAPFGYGNARPLLTASNIVLAEPPKKIGNDRHLSFRLKQYGATMRGVAFGGGEWYDELIKHNGPLKIAFRPIINHFQGRRNVEVQITDWQPDEEAAAPA